METTEQAARTHLLYTTQNGRSLSYCGLSLGRMVETNPNIEGEQRADPTICRNCIRALPPHAATAGIPGKTAV